MKAIVHAVAGLGGGALTGAGLGALGALLSSDARMGLASVLALVAVVLGVLELSSPQTRGPRGFDHETPQRWMHTGPISWAIRNGLTLGTGFASRLGFWLWYVVPLGSLLSGDRLVGGLVYGLYGLTRTLAPAAVMTGALRRPGWDYGLWLLGRGLRARSVAAAHLVVCGAAVAVAVGL